MPSETVEKLTRADAEMRVDYIIFGITLRGALLLYNLAKSGKRVALVSRNDFDRGDCYTFTNIFPKKFTGIPKSGRDLHDTNLLRRNLRHLVLQQRILFFGSPWKNRLLSAGYNLLASSGKTERSLVINLSGYTEYAPIVEAGYSSGVLSREFRINESRIIIDAAS